MKKAVVVFSVLFTLAACNTPEKLLTGTWKLQDVEFNERVFNLTAEQKTEMIRQLRDSCVFSFNKDHTYSARLIQKTDVGTWRVSRDTIYTTVGSRKDFSTINVLNNETLDVTTLVDGSQVKFVLGFKTK